MEMVNMAKESRVIHLQMQLSELGMKNALRALNWMIETMNATNGYKRKDGSNYYYHLVDATQDLLNAGIRDEVTIIACILHDAVEDIPRLSLFDIARDYGFDVADVVAKVTKLDHIDYKDYLGENIRNYLNTILEDVRACLVKTADRKHNFSTLYATSEQHELRQANETEKYFIPFFKQARKKHPEYSAYFHSAKTTIVPHLKKIQKAHENEVKLRVEITKLKRELEHEKRVRKGMERKVERIEKSIDKSN